jgi:hypothetical protein
MLGQGSWAAQRRRFTGLLEKIMTKSNDSSNRDLGFRELRDGELQEVSGGDVRRGGAIIVYDYQGNALHTQHPAKVTVPDIKLWVS